MAKVSGRCKKRSVLLTAVKEGVKNKDSPMPEHIDWLNMI